MRDKRSGYLLLSRELSMKPISQTEFAPPDGNCLQACLASIFELSLDVVPEFQYLYEFEHWHDYLVSWTLNRYGLQPIWISPENFTPQGYHLIGGKTEKGVEHVVVGYQGQIVHDPIPGGAQGFRPEVYVLFVSTLELKL